MSFVSGLLSGENSTAKTAVLATVVLATSLAVYSFFSSGSSAAGSGLAPAIPEEDARRIMAKILEKVKMTVPKLLRAADNIKQQIAAQGQEIDDYQLLKSFVLPHFETAIRDITSSTCDEFDCDEDELEEAVNEYIKNGDEELIDNSKTMRMIYKQFGGDVPEDEETTEVSGGSTSVSSKKVTDMNLEAALALLTDLAQRMVDNTDKFAEAFIANYGIPSTQDALEKFQTGLFHVTESVEKELLADVGMTTTDFQNVLMKHQNERAIQEVFYMMQLENKRILDSHGIKLM